MFDTHYDLLSIAYVGYLKNDFSYLKKISKFFNSNNVRGVIANLYFMSKEEMIKELDENYYNDNVSVLDMFKKSKEILDTFLTNTKIIYSIEGADFIKDERELEELYNAGLNTLIIAWNTKSKYASGIRSNQALTIKGKRLIKKAIGLGMGIDLSHANKNTFNDIIKIIKKSNKLGIDVVSFASHSNSKVLCNRERNLNDEQLEKIRDVGGLVGVFSNINFVISTEKKDIATLEEKENMYLEHIKHISNIVGISNITLATDDMGFCANVNSEYENLAIYNYSNIKNELENTLKKEYSNQEMFDIMYGNANEKIYNKLKMKKKINN